MTDRKSSKALATTASEIMSIAKHGGPIQHFKREIEEKFFTLGVVNPVFLGKLDSILRPYIDNAESLAASVLSQRKP